jgi:hypothetical protein
MKTGNSRVAEYADELEKLIQAGKESSHRRLTRKVVARIWQRGRKLAKNSRP